MVEVEEEEIMVVEEAMVIKVEEIEEVRAIVASGTKTNAHYQDMKDTCGVSVDRTNTITKQYKPNNKETTEVVLTDTTSEAEVDNNTTFKVMKRMKKRVVRVIRQMQVLTLK